MAKKAKRERSANPERFRFKVRIYNRCPLCGRPRAYMRKFDMCRICFRSHALKGNLAGVRKSSW